MQTYIPYSETGYFSKLILDYLSDSQHLKEFIKYPFSFEEFERVIAGRKNSIAPERRAILAEEIQSQYLDIENKHLVYSNIDSLRDENTFCIVTAHQLNIFTGPLYVLIKIANTIQ